MTEGIRQPFTNVQLELLKVFANHVSDSDLREIQKMLARFFAERAMDEADRVWKEKGWTDEDVDKMLNTKMRTPYKKVK